MASIPHSDHQDKLEEILKGIGDLAALPQVVYKIVELTGSTMTAAQEIERVIAVDPGFSAKILVLANSAYYALPRKLTSISEAVTMLGFRTVRQLAMTIGVFEVFIGKNDASSLRRRSWWRHSIDAALCAQAIAKLTGAIAPDEAYTCGLLHDIGKPLLDRYCEATYEDVSVLVEAGMSPLRAEERVFGCNHAELGGAAAHRWGFPEDLSSCIRDHHIENPATPTSRLAITVLANEISKRIVAGSGPEVDAEKSQEYMSYPDWATAALGLDEVRLAAVSRACAEAIASKSAMGAF